MSEHPRSETHALKAHALNENSVDNQPPEFAPHDLWAGDAALREAVVREGGEGFDATLAAYGRLAGDALYALSWYAHRDRPRLRTHDRFGQRIDRVEFHPAYHEILSAAVVHGVAGLSWAPHSWNTPGWSGPQTGGHVARAALSFYKASTIHHSQ
jgi:putative acyl-CoA dehydrogenase